MLLVCYTGQHAVEFSTVKQLHAAVGSSQQLTMAHYVVGAPEESPQKRRLVEEANKQEGGHWEVATNGSLDNQ